MKAFLTAGIATSSASGVALFGQGPLLDPGVGSVIGNVGIVGILIWHLWYHTSHSYPRMLERFAAEQQSLRDAFSKEQEAIRHAFLEEQRMHREHTSRETMELRNMLIETLRGMRVAVHDVKDTAQVAVTKAAEAVEQVKRERGNSS